MEGMLTYPSSLTTLYHLNRASAGSTFNSPRHCFMVRAVTRCRFAVPYMARKMSSFLKIEKKRSTNSGASWMVAGRRRKLWPLVLSVWRKSGESKADLVAVLAADMFEE